MFRIDKEFAGANIPKTIRFTEELDAKLHALAKGEHISFNELVLRCCQYARKRQILRLPLNLTPLL